MRQVRWVSIGALLVSVCLISDHPGFAATYRFRVRKQFTASTVATASSAELSPGHLAAMKDAGFAVLEDYGPFAIVEGPQSDVTALQATTGLAFDRDEDAFLLHLAGIAIDTSSAALAPALDKDLQLSDYAETTGLYVLQFHGPLRPAWLDILTAAGVRPLQYVGSYAYMVAAPRGIAALRAHFKAPVNYVGVLQPAFKLPPGLRAITPAVDDVIPMAALLDAGQDLSTILADLAAIDGERRLVDEPRNGQQRVNFSASARQARALARSSAVMWIEPVPEAVLSDERADQLIAGHITGGQPDNTIAGHYGDWLAASPRLLGPDTLASEIVDVLDTGVEVSNMPGSATCVTPNSSQVGHPDLNNGINPNYTRLAYVCPSADSGLLVDGIGHGTLVASIIAGNPAQTGGAVALFTPPTNPPDSATDSGGFFWNTGVAPGVHFGSTKFFTDGNVRPFGQYSLSTIANNAWTNGARYQNSSWNTGVDSYTLDSHDYDLIVRNAGSDNATHSMTVVFSAGNFPNGGPLNTNAPATAKNVISVGASGILRIAADVGACSSGVGINDVTSFSSRGAAYNAGIFKPDLVAPGQVVVGAFSLSHNFTYLNDCYGSNALPNTGQNHMPRGLYYPVQGTSYAAPQVTGASVLVKKVLGSAAPSLIKATLVANAESMHGGTDQFSHATLGWEPSAVQGWGRLSLKRFFDGTSRVYWSENPAWTFTATGQSRDITLTVSEPSKPVLVALAWTDLPGQPGSPNPLVDSIGLYVYHGNDIYCDGLNYYGGQYHTPQNACFLAPDQVNNVKMIRIAPNTFPTNGQFTIQVYALGINGIPGPGVPLSQDWSAYVYNAR